MGEYAASREPDGDEDVRLMLAFRGGDVAAFDVLYRRHGGPLLRHLERIVRQQAIAEELLAETFLRVHRGQLRSRRASVRGYTRSLRACAERVARPQHARPHRSTDESLGDGALPTLVADLPGVAELAHARRVGAALGAALEAIPERQREALLLTSVDGRSYAQVAAALGTTEKSVKALVHRARVAPPNGCRSTQTTDPDGRTRHDIHSSVWTSTKISALSTAA